MVEIPTTVEIGFILYGTLLILIALVLLLLRCLRTLTLRENPSGAGGGEPLA